MYMYMYTYEFLHKQLADHSSIQVNTYLVGQKRAYHLKILGIYDVPTERKTTSLVQVTWNQIQVLMFITGIISANNTN